MAPQACHSSKGMGAGVWHGPSLALVDRQIVIRLTRANFGGCRLCIAVATPVTAVISTAIIIAAVGCCCGWHIGLLSLASRLWLSRRQRLPHCTAFCAFCTPACHVRSVLLLLLLLRLQWRLLASTEAQMLHAAADATKPATTLGAVCCKLPLA